MSAVYSHSIASDKLSLLISTDELDLASQRKRVFRRAKLALTQFWWSEAYPAPMTRA